MAYETSGHAGAEKHRADAVATHGFDGTAYGEEYLSFLPQGLSPQKLCISALASTLNKYTLRSKRTKWLEQTYMCVDFGSPTSRRGNELSYCLQKGEGVAMLSCFNVAETYTVLVVG